MDFEKYFSALKDYTKEIVVLTIILFAILSFIFNTILVKFEKIRGSDDKKKIKLKRSDYNYAFIKLVSDAIAAIMSAFLSLIISTYVGPLLSNDSPNSVSDTVSMRTGDNVNTNDVEMTESTRSMKESAPCDDSYYPIFHSLEVSSTLDSQGQYKFWKENLLDGDSSTCWCEGTEGNGIGEWILFSDTSIQYVKEIHINNGYGYRTTKWI